MKENWITILGTDGKYAVSDLGRVKRLVNGTNSKAGHILTPCSVSVGYLAVDLPSVNSAKGFSLRTVHAMVAHHFIGAKPAGMQVNHIDGDKINNALTNLEYVTPKQNTQHMLKLGLKKNFTYGETNGMARTDQETVDLVRHLLTEEYSQKDVAEMTGVGATNVSRIWNNKRWAVRTPGK